MDVIEKQEADGIVKSGSTQDAGGVEEQSDGKKVFKCKEVGCAKVFKKRRCFKKHILNVHSKNKYKCLKCDKVFASLDYVHTHVWKVHEKQFICKWKDCSYETSYRNRFNVHIKTHCKKTRTCEIIARVEEPAETSDPVRVEEPAETSDIARAEKPVTKSTKTEAGGLQESTSKKLYKCEIKRCSLAFSQNYMLIRHVRNSHSLKKFKCSECSNLFKSFEYLKTHFRDCHSEKYLRDIQKQKEKLKPAINLLQRPVKVFLPPKKIEEPFDLSDLTVSHPPYQFTKELTSWFKDDFDKETSCILKKQFFQKVIERKLLKKVEKSLVYVYLEETQELVEIRRNKTLTPSAFKVFLGQLTYFGQGSKNRAFQQVKDCGIMKNQAKINDTTKRLQKHFLKKLNVVSIINNGYYSSETTQMIESAMLHGYAEDLEKTPLTNKMKGNLHLLKKWDAGDVRTLGVLFLFEYFELYVKGEQEIITFNFSPKTSLIRAVVFDEKNENHVNQSSQDVTSKELTELPSISNCVNFNIN